MSRFVLKGDHVSMKTCNKCQEVKPFDAFDRRNGGRNGYRAECKTCRAAKVREWHQAHPDKVKNNNLKSNYGITIDDYKLLLETHNNLCAICKLAPTATYKSSASLNVDHDHTTGRIRGLLCNKCNSGIGFFQESPELLGRAVIYLTQGE